MRSSLRPSTPHRANTQVESRLLAIDLGLRTGMAVFGEDGRLLRYRSQHYATRGSLGRAIPAILDAIPGLTTLVVEGGGGLLKPWERGHDLAEKSRRPIVLVQRPVATRHPMWHAVFAKKASRKGAQRNTSAEPGTSTRPALISLIGDGNRRAPSRAQVDESESTREGTVPEAPRSTDDKAQHRLPHERPVALPLNFRANADKRYKE